MKNRTVYLVANGDLRASANQKCEAAQLAMEALLAQGRPVFVERTREPVTLAVGAALPTYLRGT